MKFILNILLAIYCCCFIFFFGCEEKSPIPSDSGSSSTFVDTSYVEIFPPWDGGGFDSPRAILIGNDQLIYVADYGKNEVVMMDASGAVLKRRSIPHPISLAQNTKLDLYVGGELSSNRRDTIGAIYKIYLARFDTSYNDTLKNSIGGDSIVVRPLTFFNYHNLDTAHMQVVWQEPGRPQRRFPGVGMLPGNGFLVARVGPNNESYIDPDNRVLKFNKYEVMETPLGDLSTRSGSATAITDIRNLTGLMTFPSTSDFIVTQNGDQVSYSVIWMVYYETAEFKGWLPKFDPSKPSQSGIDFVKPNRFRNATGVTYDKRRRDIFIVDSELDSVVKFNRNGQFKTESFGKFKTTLIDRKTNQLIAPGLNKPSGIAFSNDCTLYIADTGNKVIRRFRLASQIQCN